MINKIFSLLLVLELLCSVYGQESSTSDSSEDSSDNSNSSDSDDSRVSGDSSDSSDSNSSVDSDENFIDFDIPDYYPCGNNSDVDCVRRYFTFSSPCRPVFYRDVPVVVRRRQPVYLPKINLTVVTYFGQIHYEGVSVETFYESPKSRVLVLTLSFTNINITTAIAEFIISRRGAVPITIVDSISASYSDVSLTAVIPKNPRINLRAASVFAYISDPEPVFELGPLFSNSSDELVAQTYQALIEDKATAVQEIYLTDAYSYFFGYFNNIICNSGVPYSE
ncbi:uncharacterized protein LOC135081274 isoform X2 [Ostrinia nubilalis]|uniref:uncharacterized protein LOC135081274 isoform X2 n=1 Tax=Ostrinia nubilalis TaxID=29057 RepID=UPI0030826073